MFPNELLKKLLQAMPNRGVDVNVQDQTTPPVLFRMNQVIGETTLAIETAIDDTVINVVSSTGMVIGQYVSVLSEPDNRFYLAKILDINTNAITMDTPLDFAFPIGSGVAFRSADMNVNGLVTPQVFSVRGDVADIGVEIDITRIIISMTCDGVVTYPKFGDLLPLANGIVLRRKNGVYNNIFNLKSNAEIAGIMFDMNIYSASNPQQGFDGLNARLTFGGQSKLGVVIRIAAGEDLQLIVQDDLSGLLAFEIMVEGHIVED